MNPRITQRVLVLLAAIMLIATSCGGSSDDEQAEDGAATEAAATDDEQTDATSTEAAESALAGELVGLFSIDPTECSEAEVSGSYFRMIQVGGSLDAGPFVPNTDSNCADPSFSALVAGADGGLTTSAAQLAPDPAFDDAGNGLSGSIIEPVKFFGVDFALGVDGEGTAPSMSADGTTLSGDMSAWTAYYANLVFNQGAPKPDGSMPGLTTELSGTIDPDTGVYVLEWSSEIVGGSFNEFTGVWHLEGTFTPGG